MRYAIIIAATALAGCVSEPEISGPDVSAVCIDGVQVLFRPDGSQTYTRVDLDDLDLDLDLAPTTRVTMRSMTVSAGLGIEDFGFADHLRVDLLPDDSAPVMVAEMDVASSGVRLEVPGDPSLDLSSALRDGNTDLELSLTGDVPGGGWAALVDMCFDVHE
jgi:hypothetical protein